MVLSYIKIVQKLETLHESKFGRNSCQRLLLSLNKRMRGQVLASPKNSVAVLAVDFTLFRFVKVVKL